MKCGKGLKKKSISGADVAVPAVWGPELLISPSDVGAFLSVPLECCSFIPVALREVHIDPDVLVLIQMMWFHIYLSLSFFFLLAIQQAKEAKLPHLQDLFFNEVKTSPKSNLCCSLKVRSILSANRKCSFSYHILLFVLQKDIWLAGWGWDAAVEIFTELLLQLWTDS